MKKIFFLFMLFTALFACKKDNTLPAGSQTITGVLHFSDPAVDGSGLTFIADNGETLLFKNEFPDYQTQYVYYKNSVGVESRLTFSDTGTTGCPFSMNPDYCTLHPLRVVQVLKLEKE